MIDKKIKFLLVLLGIALTASVLSWFEIASADSDKDGIPNSIDNCSGIINSDQADFDFDRLGNACDPDDDNDLVDDSLDMFDTDPQEWLDFDFDGVGSNKDSDDDNDGILDVVDSEPTLPSEVLANKYLLNIQACAETNPDTLRLVCYSEFFGDIAKNVENNTQALELSIVLSKIGTIDDCHFVSHEIGYVAFTENQNVTKSLKGMNGTMCRGGFYHGVLASYFHKIKESGEPFPSSYRTICDNLIGSSNYQDCLHGIGHGLVHYFGDELNSPLELCHNLSFYQDILCKKGVMMQYTDDILTINGISKDTISNICDEEQLEKSDYVECSMSIGTTLAFFTNHVFDDGAKSCNLIENNDTKNYCIEGLRLEIDDSEKYELNPLNEESREKFQPQPIEGNSEIIDIRSPALISNFEFIPQIDAISFSIDRPQYVILYIPSEFISPKMQVTVNGNVPNKLESQDYLLGQEMVMIKFVPNNAGIVLISPVP